MVLLNARVFDVCIIFRVEWPQFSARGSRMLARDNSSGETPARGRAGQVVALGPREPQCDAEGVLGVQRPLVASERHVVGRQLLRYDLRLPL